MSNHRQAVDDLKECSRHITVSVPDPSQRVEYLIDSISCSANTLQATIGLVRSNTNNMRSDFELAASALIGVDSYHKAIKIPLVEMPMCLELILALVVVPLELIFVGIPNMNL